MALSDNTTDLQAISDAVNDIMNRMRTNLVAQGVTVPEDTVLEAMAEMVLSVAGEDGISCTHSWSGTTLSVTSASGTSSANLKGDEGEIGLNWCGEWDETITYENRDAVFYNGAAYINVTPNDGAPEGVAPDEDDETWELLASKGGSGFSIYTHPGGAIEDGDDVYVASIRVSEGRTLQVGDLVLGANGAVCKVTSISSDGVMATLSLQANIKGATGQRGAGIYSVTTAPSSYTTAIGDFTPKYRIALSTAKTQSGASEILVGDQIRYSYYTYPIGYIDASYAYMATRVSLRGAAGATAEQVIAAMSTETWTFTLTDGSTIDKVVPLL